MQTKFKKGQAVKIKFSPIVDDIEPYPDPDESVVISPGMKGIVNVILPNGKYHVRVFNKEGDTIAYIAIDEEGLEEV